MAWIKPRGWAAGLLVLLAGCGFQLRQAEPLPAVLQELRVEAADPLGLVARELASQLQQNGARVVQSDSATQLLISSELFDRQIFAVDERARVSEYELRLQVRFEVRDAQGGELLPTDQVELTRNFAFDELAAIGASQEEALIREELTRDAARQILLRVARGLQPAG